MLPNGVRYAPSGYWRISTLPTVVDNQAGREYAILMEPGLSRENCLKTRRLPPAVPEPVEGSDARCVSQRLLVIQVARTKNLFRSQVGYLVPFLVAHADYSAKLFSG